MKTLIANNLAVSAADRRRGFTLAEIVIAMAIMAVLVGVLAISANAVFRSQNRSDAQQEIAMLAAAIDKYANFWPAWEVLDNNGALVRIADRGWPDYIPARLFDANGAASAYLVDASGRFNSPATPGFYYAVDDRAGVGFSGLIDAMGNGADRLIEGNVLNGNICLAYGLTTPTGKGPYLEVDDNRALLRDVASQVPSYDSAFPRPAVGATTNLHAVNAVGSKLMLVDPWGTPYRYFWVYRELNTPSGFAPVAVADVNITTGVNQFHRAVGYVLESAGPDRKFGNRWATYATQLDANEAADNLIVQRP
ncbi:MAG TPA: type II secretion system protein [Phycisphaerae bacterium]|nr:type II secretion system protein [Phycisphaerae bacterium]